MSEYELIDAIQAMSSNLIAGEALFLTVLSAYAVVVFVVGIKLNTYQITFVNFVFVGFVVVNLGALYVLLEQVYYYAALLGGLRHEAAVPQPLGLSVIWLTIGVRTLMSIGALIFMWQVRHPGTE